MSDKRTPEERAILESWPVVTSGDIQRMNALFPHYLFFRPEKDGTRFYASCCGQSKFLETTRRTEYPWERKLLENLKHNAAHFCPWCGRSVTVKDLRKAGKRRMLNESKRTLLLHATEEALYADAVVLNKSYETEADLTAPPKYWLSSGYRFAPGDVMQVDYQGLVEGWFTHERGRLGRRKLVQEPFKAGSISWFHYEPYFILNRSAVKKCPVTCYSHYFSHWKPNCRAFWDFVSYMTAYCIYPRQIEMLVKAGLHEPVEALISKRKKFAGAIRWEEPDIRKSTGLSAPELREVLELKPPMLALELRSLARRWFSLRWTVREAADFLQTWGEDTARYFLTFCRRYHLEPCRLARYLAKHCVVDPDLTWMDIADVFTEYRDYLEAAYFLGLCLDHSRVLFPEDLQTAHDQATAQLLERQTPAAANKAAAKGAARMKKYSFELDGLRIVFPLTAASIRREGKALHHCVGGYAERHIKGVLTILFLRKASAPNTPYVTIEMDGNQIRQIHGYDNERSGGESPRKVHKEFLDSWLAWLKAGSRRDQDRKPILPKRKEEAKIA